MLMEISTRLRGALPTFTCPGEKVEAETPS